MGVFACGADTRCAGPRRTGEDFDSLPFALLDLPHPSPDDQGLWPLDPGAI